MRSWSELLFLLIAFALIGCESSEKAGTGGDLTAAGLTDDGWLYFEAGYYATALDQFESAQEIDATHGPAHTGEGWARLMLAEALTEIDLAHACFGAALSNGETGAEVYGGRAALWLAADFGSQTLSSAIEDAQAARSADPAFIFDHLPSFDLTDLWRIEAYAEAASGDFPAALAAADAVIASGIDPLDRGTWVVGAASYEVFEEAVLAHLMRLSEENL